MSIKYYYVYKLNKNKNITGPDKEFDSLYFNIEKFPL